jgi:hypothetical protein
VFVFGKIFTAQQAHSVLQTDKVQIAFSEGFRNFNQPDPDFFGLRQATLGSRYGSERCRLSKLL